MWLEVSKYVLFKWWCHSGSTYDIWSFGWDNQSSQSKITKKGSQIHGKSSENRPLGPPWDPLGATLEPLGKHLGHMLPKNLDFKGFGEGLGSPRQQLGSNLEVKRLPNRGQSPKKTMIKNVTFFASIFKGFGRHFGMVFARFFGPKMHATSVTLNCVKS